MNLKIKSRKKELMKVYDNLEQTQSSLEKIGLDVLKDKDINDEEITNILELLEQTEKSMVKTISTFGSYIGFYSIYKELEEQYNKIKEEQEVDETEPEL